MTFSHELIVVAENMCHTCVTCTFVTWAFMQKTAIIFVTRIIVKQKVWIQCFSMEAWQAARSIQCGTPVMGPWFQSNVPRIGSVELSAKPSEHAVGETCQNSRKKTVFAARRPHGRVSFSNPKNVTSLCLTSSDSNACLFGMERPHICGGCSQIQVFEDIGSWSGASEVGTEVPFGFSAADSTDTILKRTDDLKS